MSDQQPADQNGLVRINCFALVAYIPGRLGEVLDEIRRELEPNSLAPRAHLTLLPPRPLCEGITPAAVTGHLAKTLGDLPALEVYLGDVEQFPVTNVVYVAVDGGFMQMRKMHGLLNSGPVCFAEPFHYHPHVTLAQGLGAELAADVTAAAAQRWAEYRGPRHFTAESFCFVQNTTSSRWVDLAEFSLAAAHAGR